jgi:hypothetical protein
MRDSNGRARETLFAAARCGAPTHRHQFGKSRRWRARALGLISQRFSIADAFWVVSSAFKRHS